MPDITSTLVFAFVVVALLLAYLLAWRATRGRSLVARAIVRGGLPLLIAAPFAAFMFMSAEAPRTLGKIEGQLSSETSMRPEPLTPAEQKLIVRPPSLERELKGPGVGAPLGGAPFGAPRLPVPTPLAPSVSIPPSVAPELKPRIVLPPALPAAPMPEARSVAPAAPSGTGAAQEPSGGAAPPDLDLRSGGGAPTASTPATPPAAASAPSTPAAAPAANSDWDVVPVFYGTDRAEEPNPKRLTYNAERARRLELGRALVTVPKIHQVPQIERPWALRIPYFDVTIYEEAEDPKKHFTMQEIKTLTHDEFLRLVRERLGSSRRYKDHAIVFVHGYNTSFDHAVYRTAQIAYDLKFDGAAFVYSWPSGGSVASYTYDRESAQASEPYLRQFLDLVVKETGAKSISIIAHSMGNQPLLDVLKDMKASAPEGVVISQIIMAAPDVDADNFVNLARRIEGFAKGVTLYAASNDRALTISRNFWQNPRAGDVLATGPLIMPGIDTIDVTAASTDVFALNHSDYAENNALLQDIGKLILSGLRPPDQRFTDSKKVTTDRGDYWRYTVP
jgi:esterase/lipase superfamily enzyme